MVKRKTPKRKTPKRKTVKKPVLHAVTESVSCQLGPNGVPVCERQTQEIKCTQTKKGITCKSLKK